MNTARLIKKVSVECSFHEEVVREIFESIFSNITTHVMEKQGSVTISKFGRFTPFTNKDGQPRMEFVLSKSLKKVNKPEPVNEFDYLRHAKW